MSMEKVHDWVEEAICDWYMISVNSFYEENSKRWFRVGSKETILRSVYRLEVGLGHSE